MNTLLARDFNLFDAVVGIKGTLPSTQSNTDPTAGNIAFVDTLSYVVIAVGVIAGLILLGTLIIGAIAYMTSAGDEKVLTKAKQQMTNAVVGFVILVMSYWVVRIIGTIFGMPDILKPTFIGP
ncbi:MAG: hypothetical protein ABIJ38_03295 [Patescibacteria group bacterium]